MKNAKRCMVMSVVLALILNLLSGLTVFAAQTNAQTIRNLETNIDTNKHAIQILRFDVKIPENASDGYTFKYIDADPKDYSVPYGYLRFKTTGKIAAGAKAENKSVDDKSWLDADTTYDRASFTFGEPFNLTARLNRNTGTVDFYMDGAWIFRQSYDEANKTSDLPIYPWRVLQIRTDSDNILPTVTLNYSIGLEEDEVVVNAALDENNKTITVDFSENVTGDFSAAVLKRVNGGTEVPLSVNASSGSSVTFKYTGSLKAANEYALVLPSSVKGAKYGNKLSSNYLYVTSKNETVTVNNEETFDNFENGYNADSNFRVKEQNGNVVSALTTNGGGKSGEGLLVNSGTVQNAVSNLFWQNWPSAISSADIQTIKFDIKPLRDDLSMGIRFSYDTTKMPLMVGFSKTGNLLAGYAWDSADNMEAESPSAKVCTYTKGTWYNIRLNWDSVNKTGTFYITPEGSSETFEKSFTASGFGKIAYYISVVYKDLMGIKTTNNTDLFVLDNVKFYGRQIKHVVNQVRFNDTDGNAAGAFDKLSKPLSSVDVTFSDDMALTNAASDNIKLYYGETEIAYTASYNSETQCYSMTPTASAIEKPGENYSIVVNGITTSGGTAVDNYTCYAETDIHTFVNASIDIVDASGNTAKTIEPGTAYTVKAKFTSNTSEVSSIPILIAKYSEGNYLDNVSLEYISKDEDITLTIDGDAESYPSEVGIYAWYDMDTILPLCEGIRVPVAVQQ